MICRELTSSCSQAPVVARMLVNEDIDSLPEDIARYGLRRDQGDEWSDGTST